MKLITEIENMGLPRVWSVWEYDETQPLDVLNEDPRMHFKCKRLVGTYRTLTEAVLECLGRIPANDPV